MIAALVTSALLAAGILAELYAIVIATQTLDHKQKTKNSTQEFNAENNNISLCSFMRQYRLSSHKRITVCNYQNGPRIDIRQFIDNAASIRGIWLNKTEWYQLLSLWGKIQNAIALADQLNNKH